MNVPSKRLDITLDPNTIKKLDALIEEYGSNMNRSSMIAILILEKYNKEFGSRGDKWYELMSVADRNLLALEYAKATKDEFDLGNFTEK